MTVFVRRLGMVALLGSLSAPALAAPHAQFTVAKEVPAYFGPEVGRAVAEALDQVDARDADVTGRVEELAGERVRLSATVRGKSGAPVQVEGPLEDIDSLCVQLASKIYPLVVPEKPAAAAKPAAEKRPLLAAAAPLSVARKLPEDRSDKEEKAADKPAPVPAAAITPVAAPTAAPPPASAPATAPPPTTPDPPRRRVDGELLHPYYGGASGSPVTPAPAPGPYYVRNRVVAHAIADSPNAWPGAGRSATHALYDFLGRRLRLSVVPIGLGLAPPQTALDEGVRSAARAVVMTRLQSVEDRGVSLRCRLEVVVVREGALSLRRIVEAEAVRRVQEDPLFVATQQALEAISTDLAAAVAEIPR